MRHSLRPLTAAAHSNSLPLGDVGTAELVAAGGLGKSPRELGSSARPRSAGTASIVPADAVVGSGGSASLERAASRATARAGTSSGSSHASAGAGGSARVVALSELRVGCGD